MNVRPSIFLLAGLAAALSIFGLELNRQVPIRILSVSNQTEMFRQPDGWRAVQEGNLLLERDRIRTGANSSALLEFSPRLVLLLERNSQMKGRSSTFMEAPRHEVHLLDGSLLGATWASGEELRIFTPQALFRIREAVFRILVDDRNDVDTVYVLDGEVEVVRREDKTSETVVVGPLQKIEVRGRVATRPETLSLREWQSAFRAYQIRPRGHAFHSRQQRISRHAGDLFRYVTEHGDFYTPNHGYSEREFFHDRASGKSVLRMYYDIFPATAFVGTYMLLNRPDLSPYEALEVDVRTDGASPGIVYLEMKFRGSAVRTFMFRNLEQEWKTYRVALGAQTHTIDEIVIYVRHGSSGEIRQGTLFFRNFHLVPEK